MATTTTSAVLVALLASSFSLGCSHRQPDVQERRRTLLRPPNVEQARAEQDQKRQVFGADGELLASDETVAGIVLPRGLSPNSSLENEWSYTATHIPAAALERYFAARLLTSSINRSPGGGVLFEKAQPKDDGKARPITLRILPLRGELDASEVSIQRTVPGRPLPTPAQVEAQLRAQREHAE